MAKKKGKKGKSKKGGKMGINTSRLMGQAGGVFLLKKFLNPVIDKYITDPKMKAAALIFAGEFAPKQPFVKGILNDQEILDGAGNALSVMGLEMIMAEFGIAGIGAPNDKDELAVVIEGVDDADMDEDVLGDDDDLNVVNEDVLGDDDLNVVNEDVLGDDDDMDY